MSNKMIDTKKILDHELDFLLDSLDFYEKVKFMDDMEFSKMREAVELLESQMKRQVASAQQEGGADEYSLSVLAGLSNYKKEVLIKEKEAILNKKLTREKITLLKAKLILLQQEKAIDNIFKNL
jgi:hypothetical protein